MQLLNANRNIDGSSFLTEILLASIECSKFALHKVRISKKLISENLQSQRKWKETLSIGNTNL